MQKKIFWISSYPKSGNTWMRSIISSLFFTKDGKFNFDLLKFIPFFDIEQNYTFVKKINDNDYKNLNKLKIISKYWINAQTKTQTVYDKNFSFFKTHSANISFNNYDYTSTNNTLGLIYIVRDPRDIAVSYSKHIGKNIDEVIYIMSQLNALTYTTSKYPSLMSRWDYHIASWQKLKVPKLIIKYEKLLTDTRNELYIILNFLKNNYNCSFENEDIIINNLLETTSFKSLNQMEKKYGFQEATKSFFFRKGESMQWQKSLSKSQIKKIENIFGPLMNKLGYK